MRYSCLFLSMQCDSIAFLSYVAQFCHVTSNTYSQTFSMHVRRNMPQAMSVGQTNTRKKNDPHALCSMYHSHTFMTIANCIQCWFYFRAFCFYFLHSFNVAACLPSLRWIIEYDSLCWSDRMLQHNIQFYVSSVIIHSSFWTKQYFVRKILCWSILFPINSCSFSFYLHIVSQNNCFN